MEPVMGQMSRDEGLTASPDDGALRHLYQTHGPALLSYLLRLTNGDRHRAEDVMQETFVRAWRHPEALSAQGQWSRAWLFTVARRIAIDQLRALRSRPAEHSTDRIEAYGEGHDPIERLLEAGEVRAALAGLPDRLRDTLIEVFFREQSVAEAAQTLGIPPGTVKSRTFYALKALREKLAESGFQPGR